MLSRMALVWWRIGVVALAFGAAAVASGCDVYDTSLLGDSAGGGGSNPDGGNGTGGTPTTGGGGQGGEGGTVACQTPDQCPGMDTECGVRTCDDGTCGIDAAAEGTPATDQMDGDCIHRECDGLVAIVGIP